MLRCLLLLSLLAGCAERTTTTMEGGEATSTGVANFSFCFGFCLNRTGPPLVISSPQPATASKK